MDPTSNIGSLSLCTFNCRSVKNSRPDVWELCNNHDIVCVQEHWLMSHELDNLSQIHDDCLSWATSAMDISNNVLTGRPYGGTGILYKRKIAHSVTVVDTGEPRMTALNIQTNKGPTLLVNVYMPTDYGNYDCYEEYLDICTKINALFNDTDAVFLIIVGDFNTDCNRPSRYYDIFQQLMNDNHLVCSDVIRLDSTFTYCRDDGLCTSWLDHVLCSVALDSSVDDVRVHYAYQSSDHKPLSVTFKDFGCESCADMSPSTEYLNRAVYDWTNSDTTLYEYAVGTYLSKIDIPYCLFDCKMDCNSDSHRHAIDKYYAEIVEGLDRSTKESVPTVHSRNNKYNIPGWTDFVKDKHDLARIAFLDWVYVGKPRTGYQHQAMCRTRASFKFALRRCKAMQEQLKADARANDLACKHNPRAFWNGINKDTRKKATSFANKVGEAVGDQNVCNMWKEQFGMLFNSLHTVQSKHEFYGELEARVNGQHPFITIDDVKMALKQLKKNKSAGPNGIYAESLLYAGNRICVHLSLLYTVCVKHCYLPNACIESILLPLVKNKGGDLTDANNYRAIALSNVETKILETIILHKIRDSAECDTYQFGFKTGHSTALCTSTLKRTVDYYLNRGSYVFACYIDFTKAFDKVNYWKLFTQLSRDGIHPCFVKLLAFWYSNQSLCVSWHGCLSDKFCISNGTRQGGVLSPYLFTCYVRPLITALCQSRIGCNVGGMFVNILVYADDMVLLAPSWRALQDLLHILEAGCLKLDMVCNTKKTVCMIFTPRSRDKLITDAFPCFTLDGRKLEFVSQFKYLGHIINDKLHDDDDIRREIKNLFVRTNMLVSRFHKCSTNVKITLFKSFCMCFYNLALWSRFTVGSFNKFRSCYNKCVKKLFGYAKYDSMSGILIKLSLPTADTIVHNSRILFANHCEQSCNSITRWFSVLRM